MNLAWLFFGLVFTAMGLVSLGLVAVAVVGHGDLVFALGTIPAALGLAIGILIMFGIPYEIRFDERCLKMLFAFGRIEVPWQCVRSYRKLFIRASFRNGKATVYAFMTYQLPARRLAHVLLMLQGTGSALSLSASEYETEVDRHIARDLLRGRG